MEAMGNAICSFVGSQFSHHRNLEDNLNKMKRKTEELNSRKDDVESAMKAEIQPGKRAKKEVELWFANIKKVNEEIEAIESKVKEGIKSMERVNLGKQICSMIQEIEDLYQKGCFSDGLVIDDEEDEEESKRRKMGNEDVGQRVIFGMGGIGETIFTNKNSTSTIKFDKVVIAEEKCLNKSESTNKEESKKKGKERKRKRETKANGKKVIFGVGGIGKTTMKNTDSTSTITFGDIQI